MKIPPKKTKNIKLGKYLKKVNYANRFLFNKYDVFMMADGYFMFKRWGKGKLMWTLTNATGIAGGPTTLMKEQRRGARFLSIEFDDSVTSYHLKSDIITALQDFYKSGGWTKGKFKDKHNIEPRDIEELTLKVTSRWF